MFKKDQKVWCAMFGEGVVTEILHEIEGAYRVVASFKCGNVTTYTTDGKYSVNSNVTLFPYPVEIVKAVTKPSIEWSHVNARFRYLAMDAEGEYHIYADKPLQCDQQWIANQPRTPAIHFASFVPGTCDWRDSLVKRPN